MLSPSGGWGVQTAHPRRTPKPPFRGVGGPVMIQVTNIQHNDDLYLRSVYCICSFLKPLVAVGRKDGTCLEVPMAEFVTPETPYGGTSGLCRGFKDKAWTDKRYGTLEEKWSYDAFERALIEYNKDPSLRKYAWNFEPGYLVMTEGKALPGFDLKKGDWPDFRYVKILRAISPVQVHPETRVKKPLVIRDAGYGKVGDHLTSYALTTGRWFRAADGRLYFECTPIKNNEAFQYTATVGGNRVYVPTRGQGSRNDYEYASGEAEQYFEVPDTLWFRSCKSVGIYGLGQDGLTALLDTPPTTPPGGGSTSEETPGGDGGNRNTRTLLNALLVGLAAFAR